MKLVKVSADALRDFSPQQVHAIVDDLMTPRMGVYWLDFLTSWAVGLTAFVAVAPLGFASVPGVMAFCVSVLALYRAVVFIHEITHFRTRGRFRRFRLMWNALCGVPLFVPVFMYDCHSEHHSLRWYGTAQDAEYVPLARMSPWEIVRIVAAVPLLPFFGVVRFGILTPLSWLAPRLRAYLYTNFSALKLDVEYTGKPPSNAAQRRSWLLQEVACFAVMLAATAVAVAGAVGWERFVQWYLTYAGIASLNTARLLGAHRYLGQEEGMSRVEQMLDTLNYPRRRLLGELWAPVGLRLHALHHLMPGLPYHSYQQAHQRLMERLPEDSPYRATEAPGLWRALRALWRNAQHRSDLPESVLLQVPHPREPQRDVAV